MAETLETLEKRRVKLLDELARTGDMRQGSLTENYRRCGKRECACSEEEHAGHGPYYAFTRKVAGRTQTVNLREGPRLRKLRREVEAYQSFRRLCMQLLEVNEALCMLRPADDEDRAERSGLKKKLPRSSRRRSRGRSSP
jgi:hypothetical protein